MRTRLALTALLSLAPQAAAQTGSFVWREQVQLTDPLALPQDRLGTDVAVDGERAAVGITGHDELGAVGVGAVKLYQRTAGLWFETATLVPADLSPNKSFGVNISLSGNTLAVGANGDDEKSPGAGAVYIYVHDGSQWNEEAKLFASVPGSNQFFGTLLDLSGDTLVVGDEFPTTLPGQAHVFERVGSVWTETLLISKGVVGDRLGSGVSVDGDTLALGAPGDTAGGFGTNVGTTYVYTHDGVSWVEAPPLNASDKASHDFFGSSVSLSGDRLLVGSPFADAFPLSDTGAAYVFERSGGTWSQVEKLVAEDELALARIGQSVALAGDTAVLAAPLDDELGGNAGAAYVFEPTGPTWSQVDKLFAGDSRPGDGFASAIDLAGSTLLASAPTKDISVADDGAAYVFAYVPDDPVAYCTAGTSAAGCQAYLSAFGSASASAPAGFFVVAANVEGAKSGILFLGTAGRQANAWGNGSSFQCVVPPVTRLGLLQGVGTPGACNGGFSLDLNADWCSTCPKPSHNPGFGAVVQLQLWYRDPQNTSNQTTSLSNALEFTVGP